jgi:hypothetical protein
MLGQLKKIFKLAIGNKPTKNLTAEPNLLNQIYSHDLTIINKSTLKLNGKIIPWYTYPAIEYLNQFDFKGKKIFEWGSGSSSSFFADKGVDKVISIEHDELWYEKVKSELKNNQELVYSDLNEYPVQIKKYLEKFDVIIIDGQRRYDCSKAAIGKLKEGGMIILDNSDWFYKSAQYLKEKLDLIQVDFHGFGPINNYTWTTSVLLSKEFNFKTLNSRQPGNAVGGLLHDELDIIKNDDQLFHTKNSKEISL